VIVEMWVSAALLLGPPVASGPAEGPSPAVDDEQLATIVRAAGIAAQDRAVLERNGEEIVEFTAQLDALAQVEERLDTCARAIQAELRMDLALAYLRASGTCGEGEGEAGAGGEVDPGSLAFPRECAAVATPDACAARLLEGAVAFGESGPAGGEDPLAQAAGCPHAAESMSVERMFGGCVVEEYGAALERWRASQQLADPDDHRREGRALAVPRWASITGIGLGVGVLAAGATLVAIDGRCPNGGDPRVDFEACPSVYNTEAGGAVLISVGALAVISMSAVLAITEVRAKRAGQRGTTARLRLRRRLDRWDRVTSSPGFAAVTGWQAPRLQLRP
jgi:hypothetical protein